MIKFTQIQNHTCGNSSIRISRERNNRRDNRFFSGGSKILLAFMWRSRGHKGVFVFLDTQKKITQGSLVITNKKLGTLIVPTSLSLSLSLSLSSTWLLGVIYQDHPLYEMARYWRCYQVLYSGGIWPERKLSSR